MSNELDKAFHTSMIDIYKTAKEELRYNATRFLSMVNDQGGVATARTLLHASKVSEGYTKLWEHQRLDLSVEALVLQPRWAPLFSAEERSIASARLKQYGYDALLPDK